MCDIFVNSQDPGLFTGPMGNATFTYGIAVKSVNTSSYPSLDDRWIVRDADGSYLDFGDSAVNPKAGPGVFSRLVRNANGSFILYDAGPPGDLRRYGAYVYYFDASGRLTKLHDPAGNWQVLTYNGSLVTRIDDLSSKKAITFAYTSNLITSVRQNGLSYQTRLSYTSGRLSKIEVLNSNGSVATSTQLGYSSGLLSYVMRDNDLNTQAIFTYTSFQTMGTSSGLKRANVQTNLYTSNIQTLAEGGSQGALRIESSDSKGQKTVYGVSSTGLIRSVTPPLYAGSNASTKITFTYDLDRNVKSIVGPGMNRSFTYSSHGQLTRQADGAGGFVAYEYSGPNLTRVYDAIGSILWLYYEDPRFPSIPSRVVDGEAQSWKSTLNAFGQVTEVTPPLGGALGPITHAFDDVAGSSTYGWPIGSASNGTEVTFPSYSATGDPTRIVSRVSPSKTVGETLVYDGAQRLTQQIHDDGTSFKWLFTGKKLSSTTDEAGIVTNYDWCNSCGHLMAIRGPMGWKNSRTQDQDRNTTGFIDSRNHTTQYDVGANRELKKVTLPDGTTREYQYTAGGKVRQSKNGRGQLINYTYDGAGRLATRTGPGISETYSYYLDGSLKEVVGGTCTVAYTYDRARRVADVTTTMHGSLAGPVQKVLYDYFPDGKLAMITWRSAGQVVCTWNYSYGTAGRVATVANSFGQTTTFAYDQQGKQTGQSNANGTTTTTTYNDLRGWVRSIVHKHNGIQFASYGLEYDNGNERVPTLTNVTENGGSTVAYAYDPLYRLKSAVRTGFAPFSETYAYDMTGNLRSLNGQAFGTYDDANKCLTGPYGANGYDLDGNTQYLGSWSNAMFTWDADSKMTSQRQGPSNPKSYVYDYAGRRVGSQATGYPAKTYVFSGDVLLGEIVNGQVVAVYTWSEDGLISEAVRSAGAFEHYWYHFGPQGETRYLSNAGGQRVVGYTYKAYGEVVQSYGAVTNPFRYGGRYGYYSDGMNHVILCGLRWYQPSLHRWLSRDPIGLSAGENEYCYAGANPVSRVDPRGTFPIDPNSVNPCAPGTACGQYYQNMTPVYQYNEFADFYGDFVAVLETPAGLIGRGGFQGSLAIVGLAAVSATASVPAAISASIIGTWALCDAAVNVAYGAAGLAGQEIPEDRRRVSWGEWFGYASSVAKVDWPDAANSITPVLNQPATLPTIPIQPYHYYGR